MRSKDIFVSPPYPFPITDGKHREMVECIEAMGKVLGKEWLDNANLKCGSAMPICLMLEVITHPQNLFTKTQHDVLVRYLQEVARQRGGNFIADMLRKNEVSSIAKLHLYDITETLRNNFVERGWQDDLKSQLVKEIDGIRFLVKYDPSYSIQSDDVNLETGKCDSLTEGKTKCWDYLLKYWSLQTRKDRLFY